MNLNGKVALVTGAGSGIGRGCATAFYRAGTHIIINDIVGRMLPLASNHMSQEVGREAGHLTKVLFADDIFDGRGRCDLIHDSIETSGRIDILVTGPASTIRKPALELEPEDFTKVYNDNFISHVHLAKLVAQDMIRRKSGGSIVFITSIYGSLARTGSLPYDAAKAALNQATKVLAKEWAPHDIRVNAIEPGFVDTPGEHKFATSEEIEAVKRKLPLGAATPEDIGKVAVMLASCEHITGQIICVDGGHGLVDLYDQVSL